MPLTPGTRLGPYEITAAIGAGGMGEVYQARDTKLDRNVAIKVLPEDFAADPDRLARFEREAKLLAALSHPNISTIFGLAEAEGVRALVLELIEGPTLADRIARGAIPLDEALPIASQIADALEAAHEAGIMHRDLKPANIKVREDGTVKVLDFGLAKALAGELPNADLSQSPTVTSAATRAGAVLGTAAYMSPEQARGKVLDKRTDIWSYGCVLYEMLVGRAPFHGETLSDTIANVLDRQPQWNALPAGTPPAIRRLLRRCLEKNPVQRLRDIGDARWEIATALGTPDSDSAESLAPARLQVWQRPLPAAMAGLLLIVLAGVALWPGSPATPPQPRRVMRFNALLPPNVSLGNPVHYRVAISTDGTRLAYAASDQLYLRDMDQLQFTPVRGTEGAVEPVFSPDGQWVAFWADGQLKKVPVAGGPPVPLAETRDIYGATWGVDDMIFFNAPPIGISRVSGQGGIPEVVVPVRSGEYGFHRPQLLPGGEWVLFSTYPGRQIEIHSLVTGERKVLIAGGGGGAAKYVPTGHLVYALAGTLLASSFDVGTQTLIPGAVRMVEGVRQTSNTAAQFDVASDGSLVYLPSGGPAKALVRVDRDGQATKLTQGDLWYPRLSPDGRRVAVQARAETTDILLYDIERDSMARLTGKGVFNTAATWQPDGTSLAFASDRTGNLALYRKAANGSGDAELLREKAASLVPGSWSADGTTLVFVEESGTSAGGDIWTLRLNGEPSAFLATEANEGGPRLSPDGQWLAYVSDQTGEDRVYVQPFPDGGAVIAISPGVGSEPAWSHDGTELFFRGGDRMMAVDVETGPAFAAGRPRVLFEGSYFASRDAGIPNYDVTPDGQFLMVKTDLASSGTAPMPQVTVILNWFEDLKRRVPGR